MRLFTREDYSIISSFCLIRGKVGRSIAISIDAKSYFDAAYISVTSSKRRSVVFAEFTDQRDAGASGYNLRKLLHHYGWLIMSAEFSGLRLLSTLALLIGAPLLILMMAMLAIGSLQGTRQMAPGWLSLFFLGVTMNLVLMCYGVYSLNLLSVMFFRSTGSPQFLVISREMDKYHLSCLGFPQ
jgi:hypothetical protein